MAVAVIVAAVGAGLLGGCAVHGDRPRADAAAPTPRDHARNDAIQQRDQRLQQLERQRRKAQRACAKGLQSQCQRVEILSHEMDVFLVQPW